MRKSAPVPQQEALTVKQAWLAGTTGCRPEPGTIGHSHTCYSLRFTAVFESMDRSMQDTARYGPDLSLTFDSIGARHSGIAAPAGLSIGLQQVVNPNRGEFPRV